MIENSLSWHFTYPTVSEVDIKIHQAWIHQEAGPHQTATFDHFRKRTIWRETILINGILWDYHYFLMTYLGFDKGWSIFLGTHTHIHIYIYYWDVMGTIGISRGFIKVYLLVSSNMASREIASTSNQMGDFPARHVWILEVPSGYVKIAIENGYL